MTEDCPVKAEYGYLRCFAAVAKTLNISAAAASLGLTQPSASRQIRLLEEALSTDLFQRDSSGVRLTESGRALAAKVLPLLGQLDEALDGARGSQDRFEGVIRFGCLTEIGQTHYLARLLKFRRDHPGVQLDVQYLKEFEILDKLRAGELDVGIVASRPEGEQIDSVRAVAERIVLVARSGLRVEMNRPADLSEARFIAYRQDDPLLKGWLRTFGAVTSKRLQVPLTVNSHRSMIDALLEMDAVAVMPWHSVEHLVEAGILRVASTHELNGQLYVATVHTTKPRRRVRALIEHLLRGDVD